MKIIALPYVVCILAPDVIRKESFVKVCFVGHGTLKSAGLWCEIFWGAPRWVLTKSDHFTAASDSQSLEPICFLHLIPINVLQLIVFVRWHSLRLDLLHPAPCV